MISETSRGFIVKSKKGKVLSRPYATREQAQKRLQQIEYFKNKK